MRTILTITCLFIGLQSFSQVFYKSFKHPHFQKLATDGITYLLSGDEEKDKRYITALENNWKVSPVKIVDPKEDISSLSKEDIVLIEAKIDEREEVLVAVRVEYLLKNSFSKYSSVAYFCKDGFNQKSDSVTFDLFLDQFIGGLNDVVSTIQKNQIKGKGTKLYKSIAKAYQPRGKDLLKKTLLIVDDTKERISLTALDENGIKYKLVSTEEYISLIEDEVDRETYALFYFAYNSYSEISIFDLADNSLIYSRHYANAKNRFGSIDINGLLKE